MNSFFFIDMELFYVKGLLKSHSYKGRIARNVPITFYRERQRDIRDYLIKTQFKAYQETFPLDTRTYEKQLEEMAQPRNYFAVFLGELLTKSEAEDILKFLKTQSEFTKLAKAIIDIGEMRDFYKFGYADRLNDRKGEYWRFNYKGSKKVYFKGYADYKDHLEYDYSPSVSSDDVEQPDAK